MSKLAVHAVAARVVEFLFANFPAKRTTKLKLEFYGPRFGLFNDGDLSNSIANPTIETIVKNQPSGKEPALESLLALINKGVEKGLFSFAYFQQIICEYVTVASPKDVRALCSSLVDHSIHLLSTRAGSRVVAECAAYGTPKDRKRILKSLKGYTRSSLLHSDAYIAMLRVIDVTDDTVNVQKALLAELQVLPEKKKKMNVLGEDQNHENNEGKSPLLELALSDTGSKFFLMLLAKDEEAKKKFFDPAELEVLRPNPTIKEGEEEVPTSKKSANTRRVELLQYMKNLLTECCKSHADLLLQSRCGSKVLRGVYETYPSKELTDAIVEGCDNEEGDGEVMSVFEHPVGHLSVKNLILSDGNSASKDNTVAVGLAQKYKKTMVDDIAASNRGAFVLAALIATDDSGDVKKEVKGQKKEINSRIKESKKMSKPSAGYEALLKAIE
jgi:pumilio family protein 6